MWMWLTSFFVSKAVPAVQHALWRTVSVLCVVGVLAFFGYAGYKIFHPKPTTTVQAGGVSNTYEIKVGFGGCIRLPTEVKK